MNELDRAVALLRAGELVAIPTETVYGLGADATNSSAVRRIFEVKGRPADHPLIVHLPDHSHLDRWARDIPTAAYTLAKACWPGPLTLILRRQFDVIDAVTGGQDTVGVRVPNHPLTLELLHRFNGGIAAPSANRFGRISPTTAAHVVEELGNRVPMILDGGACEVGIESTIVDLSGPQLRVLRPGQISSAAIHSLLGSEFSGEQADPYATVPRVSGSLDAHYAPRTPMRLVSAEKLGDALAGHGEFGRVAVLARLVDREKLHGVPWLKMPIEASAYAHDIYAALRELDNCGYQCILVEAPPDLPDWHAIRDRLQRAATGAGKS